MYVKLDLLQVGKPIHDVADKIDVFLTGDLRYHEAWMLWKMERFFVDMTF